MLYYDSKLIERPVGQAVKTPPFHGGNMGSSPVRVTKKDTHLSVCVFFCRAEIEDQICLSGGQAGCTSSKTGTPQYLNDSRTGHHDAQIRT